MKADERVEKARKAYDSKDIEQTKKAHTKKEIEKASEQHTRERGKYLGDLVFGALDGIVTTFAVVSGVEGAKLSYGIVLIMGFANLFGDGISMALGNFLSSRSEIDYVKKERERESWEVDNYPQGETEEIRYIYSRKGFKGKDLDRAVAIVTSDKKRWVDTMMYEELGLKEEEKNPVMGALATFFAFGAAGIIPLIAYVLGLFFPSLIPNPFLLSVLLAGTALFTVGALRTFVTGLKWYRSGIEMLFVGGIAAMAAYLVGFLLKMMGV